MKDKARLLKIKGSEYDIKDEEGNIIEFGTYIPDNELKDMGNNFNKKEAQWINKS